MNTNQGAEFFARVSKPAANEAHEQVHASYVKIGEVGAIRFVQVIVTVHEVGAGRYNHGLEECGGTSFRGETRRREKVVAKRCA